MRGCDCAEYKATDRPTMTVCSTCGSAYCPDHDGQCYWKITDHTTRLCAHCTLKFKYDKDNRDVVALYNRIKPNLSIGDRGDRKDLVFYWVKSANVLIVKNEKAEDRTRLSRSGAAKNPSRKAPSNVFLQP